MDISQKIQALKQALAAKNLPSFVSAKIQTEIERAELVFKSQNYSLEVDRILGYIDLLMTFPWTQESPDILDLNRAREILDRNHFGLDSVKERVLEYLAILILNKRKNMPSHSLSLLFLGLVGSGKTSLAYSIAEALGRELIRIPFGGLAGAHQLRGESRLKIEAQPGLIVEALLRSKVKNPIILLDELDRVATEVRSDVMGVLVELLDPEQNQAFSDYYFELPIDLSEVIFIATANNTNNVSTAVLDRLETVEIPFYSDEQKVMIAKQYLLPKSLKESGLDPNTIAITETLWPEIVRPLGFDGGIRSLKRTIDNLVRKVAKQVVEGKIVSIVIDNTNLPSYIIH